MRVTRRAIARLSLALLAGTRTAHAQRLAGLPRVGVLEGSAPSVFADRVQALRQGLAELGYVDGQGVALDIRWAQGRLAELPRLAAELVLWKADVIVAGTTVAALAARQTTTTVPIVFAVAADPVGVGLVASLSRPGGNATGLTTANADIVPKRLELLQEIAGGKAARAAVLYAPSDPSNVIGWRNAQDSARQLGLPIRGYTVNGADDYEAAFKAMAADRVDALMVAAGALADSHARRLAELAARHRLPAMYGARGFVEAGGLVSYSANFSDNYRRAATYVHKILQGAAPGELPVEQANRFELAINLRTARDLGLNVSTAFRLRADLLIE